MIERGGDGPNTQISPVTLQISRFNHDLSRVSCNYDITRRICPYIPAATMFRMIIGKGFQLPFILVINLVSIVILCTTIYHTPSFSS